LLDGPHSLEVHTLDKRIKSDHRDRRREREGGNERNNQ
jgi:hypothetical protein